MFLFLASPRNGLYTTAYSKVIHTPAVHIFPLRRSNYAHAQLNSPAGVISCKLNTQSTDTICCLSHNRSADWQVSGYWLTRFQRSKKWKPNKLWESRNAQFITINVFWVVFVCFFYFWSACFSTEDKNTDNWVLKDQTQYISKIHLCLSVKKYDYHIKNLKLTNHLLENYAYAKYFSCCVQLKMKGGDVKRHI